MVSVAHLTASLRLVVATMLVCVVGYTLAILGIAQLFPETASGSLIRNDRGQIVGSARIAQNFTSPGYFWPRPSAAGENGYDATAASGSNLSPTSPEVRERGREIVESFGASESSPLPAELAAASGNGLDPHITVAGARYQVARVAGARDVSEDRINRLIDELAYTPGGFLTKTPIVNVLKLNLALDGLDVPGGDGSGEIAG